MSAFNFVDTSAPKKSTFNPSVYQQGVKNWVDENISKGKHLIVQACAGSGKTTTGVWLFEDLPSNLDTAFVAYNTHIAAVLKDRLPQGSNARTYHSLGMMTLRRNFPNLKVDNDKVERFLRNAAYNSRWATPSAKRLVSLCKGGIDTDFDYDDIVRLAYYHDIDLYDDEGRFAAKDLIVDLVQRAIYFSYNNPEIIDFDDMIWLPNVLPAVSFYQFDFLLGDEFQDTNIGQMYLAMRSIKQTGNILGVGDRWQSIYAFRGAASNALDSLKATLKADELPLSLSYRCPVAVGQLVNATFPHIKFELPEWAKDGKVYDMLDTQIGKTVQPNDMILCRVNADLVMLAYSLIRQGIKATVRGRDIGRGLQALIRKSKKEDVGDLMGWLADWEDKEIMKAMRLGAEDKIQSVQDKVQTIYAISDGANTVAEILGRCETLFSDEKNGVTLSTIHKAKGLESERVFILRPDLLPHPAAKKPEQIQQEQNLKYVAYTRSLNELIFIR